MTIFLNEVLLMNRATESRILSAEKSTRHAVVIIVCIMITLARPVNRSWADSSSAADDSLKQLSLEQLGNVEVTTVSKEPVKITQTPAAIYVLTQEDIRRSGATSLPEVLRMVPGLQVSRSDDDHWSVGIRGFADQFSKSMLVMVDGRSLYTPLFAGVYWALQDGIVLEDIERIEVIRGPGGTVWGANAVNGVINIITRSAADTHGGLASIGAGSQLTGRGLVRYGGSIGQAGSYRAFGSFFRTGNLTASGGQEAADRWHSPHMGFRSDWNLTSRDSMTVEGDLLQTSEGQTIHVVFSNALPSQGTFNDKVTVTAGNLLGRWERSLDNG